MTATPTTATPAAVPVETVTFTIDGRSVTVPKGTLVIRAAEQIGVEIPRFCDHPLLEPVGACRQCLVEVAMPGPDGSLKQMQGPPGRMKPQASCTLVASEGMQVNTQLTSPGADKAQQGVMELLLINHPLDCPVCDKGGECPLQNQAMSAGRSDSRFAASGGVKRTFPKPINLSAQVLLDRERCVLCARCTRFSKEIAGDPFIELIERGALQQVGIAAEEPFESYFSGNTIQICPVGALTSAEYRFRSRPFDLVSVPSVAEHDSCGAEIRVDHRRGKVMRRLAGNDPEVNEEWITDKDRFAFAYSRSAARLRHPQVRDEQGELRPASWTEAFAVAARGLAAACDGLSPLGPEGSDLAGSELSGAESEGSGTDEGTGRGVGVLTGGRLSVEDAYAYAKFARVALGTHDIDFRARPHSAEEAEFLAAVVALGTPPTYADLEAADTVLLAGLEPEEEAGTLFLRLRKAVKRGTRVTTIAAWVSPGARKLSATLVPTTPGQEAQALAAVSGLGARSVILLGERLATSPGALTAALDLATTSGARLAWVPRRAGDRGAVEAGCLPTLLPGGRPVSEASARVDLATAWGVASLPEAPGRDGDAIVAAAAAGDLRGLVVAGVDPDDTADPALFRQAVENADFVVALDLTETWLTARADVVFPVAPVTDKAGTFLTWDGRARAFEACFTDPHSLPDLRVLAGIAEELATLGSGGALGFRTVGEVRQEMAALGPWDGPRPTLAPAGNPASQPAVAGTPDPAAGRSLALATWRLMLDDSALLAGATQLQATARRPVARLHQETWAALGSPPQVRLIGDRGEVTLPVEAVAEGAPDTVWVPTRSFGRGVWADLAAPGTRVTVEGVRS